MQIQIKMLNLKKHCTMKIQLNKIPKITLNSKNKKK